MNESRLHAALRETCRDLADSHKQFALVGGLAVSARTQPRFTRDLDLVIALTNDNEAEELVRYFRSRNYRIEALVEHEAAGRLATVRLIPPAESGLFVDLLFASCGIEPEIVRAAEQLEIIEGLTIPVATVFHLIAMKVLSRDDKHRPQDRIDLAMLLDVASEQDLENARASLKLITERGFNRKRNLLEDFAALQAQ
jgi:predicted nucleotidyltransferase